VEALARVTTSVSFPYVVPILRYASDTCCRSPPLLEKSAYQGRPLQLKDHLVPFRAPLTPCRRPKRAQSEHLPKCALFRGLACFEGPRGPFSLLLVVPPGASPLPVPSRPFGRAIHVVYGPPERRAPG